MRRIALVLTVLALFGAACGSSSKSTNASSDNTTTTAADPAKDKTLADSLVLAATDYPSDYKTATASPDTQDSTDKKLNDCTGATGPTEDSAKSSGPDASKDNAQISSSATVKKTKDAFDKDVAALSLDKLQGCTAVLKSALQAQMAKDSSGTTVTDLKIESLPISAKYGDVTKGFRVTVQLDAGGQTIPLSLDLVAMGKDRAEVSLTFINVGGPFDSATEQALIAKAGAKLK